MKQLFTLLMFSLLVTYGFEAHAQKTQKTITGTVLDVDKIPVLGVNIVVPGTTIGTITDFDGKYSLTVPITAKSLTFSYIGYATQTVDIGLKTEIIVTLEVDAAGLDEVVIVG